jgi:hypothetical protein
MATRSRVADTNMPSKAKAKGNSGERELCKILAEIFEGSFIRVPGSGAYIGGINAVRREYLSEGQVRHAKGDIQPPDFMPKLVLECKFYADFPFHALMTPGSIPQLDTWIEQTLDCVETGDVWYVAFKINRRGFFAAVPFEGSEKYTFGNHAVYTGKHGKFIVTELTEFFTNNKDAVLQLTA